MFEKVNPMHPDKIADRIAGAMVDLAYKRSDNPKIAVEVLIGHGECHIIAETSVCFSDNEIEEIVGRIAGGYDITYIEVPQDKYLANNQNEKIRCGDNGIFKGVPVTAEQEELASIAKELYETYKSDGKYIIDKNRLIICQSNAVTSEIK